MADRLMPAKLRRLLTLEQRRERLRRQRDELDRAMHAAILEAIDDGASVALVARHLGISRQALTRYLERRTPRDA